MPLHAPLHPAYRLASIVAVSLSFPAKHHPQQYNDLPSLGKFATFTWAHWQGIQAQAVQNFTRFQRAISQQQPQLAALIALEMLHIAAELQKEAVAWISVK